MVIIKLEPVFVKHLLYPEHMLSPIKDRAITLKKFDKMLIV